MQKSSQPATPHLPQITSSESPQCPSTRLPRAGRGGLLTAALPLALFAVSLGTASAQTGLPDAQVEANVLKALAGAPELASLSISTRTVYGVVTLSGSVPDDSARTRAENLAANADGVRKVVDELSVGGASVSSAPSAQPAPAPGMVLQSDGTYGPDTSASTAQTPPQPAVQPQRNDPEHDQALDQQMEDQQANPSAGAGQSQQPGAYPVQPAYPPSAQGQAPDGTQSSPQSAGQQSVAQQPVAQQPQYPQQTYPPQQRYPQANRRQQAPWGGQVAGQQVVVPSGSLVRVQVDQLIASDRVKTGDTFHGFVANDVVADGFVAIPRGAAVQGVVVDAHPSGAVKGRGELSIELKSVTLGGKVYPIVSDVWAHNGTDKTIQTINSAAGFGVAGALIGALAGRGTGAAIGAGVGAAAGVGASAASGRGQVVIPPEGMVAFRLTQSAQVQTVSEQEIQRLAYGVPNGPGGRQPLYPPPAYARYPAPAPYPYGYPPPYGYPAPY